MDNGRMTRPPEMNLKTVRMEEKNPIIDLISLFLVLYLTIPF